MKIPIYLRIGKDNKKKEVIRVEASDKPNFIPLKIGTRFIPTVSFGIEVDVPEELYSGAGLIVGLLKLETDQVEIATHIKVLKPIK